jgi:acyl-CoA reductase-like NAD-dependent aldehyde dehydrogenase
VALSEVTMETIQLLIGKGDVPATGSATFVRKSPLTGEPATQAAAASVADANAAAAAAAAALPDLRWITIQTTPRHYPF